MLEAYIRNEISTRYFTNEFSLIFSRYDNLGEIENQEFNLIISKDVEVIFSELNDLCSRYYENISDEDMRRYKYTTESNLKKMSRKAFKKIVEKELIIIK